MKTIRSSRKVSHLRVLVALAALAVLPLAALALPVCPSDGIGHQTSGSIGTGSTCNEAFTNLVSQEVAKMDCEFGLYSEEFHHNNCTWNGSAYQVLGWYDYECQTNCHEPAF